MDIKQTQVPGWPIEGYECELWNGLPHPNRAAELLRWAAERIYLPLRPEALAASETVLALSARLTAMEEALREARIRLNGAHYMLKQSDVAGENRRLVLGAEASIEIALSKIDAVLLEETK